MGDNGKKTGSKELKDENKGEKPEASRTHQKTIEKENAPEGLMGFELIPDNLPRTNPDLKESRYIGEETQLDIEGVLEQDKVRSFSDIFRLQEFAEINKELQFIIKYFDSLVQELGFMDTEFFNNPEQIQDFVDRFKKYSLDIERKLDNIASQVCLEEMSVNFSDDWRDNLKTASYYAFFLHYGAKRKNEVDSNGDPLDYVYHVVNAAMSKMIFKDEPAIIACVLHDVLEDWQKGVSKLLNSNSKSFNQDFIDTFDRSFSEFCEYLDDRSGRSFEDVYDRQDIPDQSRNSDPFYCRSILRSRSTSYDKDSENERGQKKVGIERLVKILTKTSSNRAKECLKLIMEIVKHKGVDRISAIRAIEIKMRDRLDNLRTFTASSNLAGVQEKAKKIELETIYFFFALAKTLRMWDMFDWLQDYIVFKDPEERERRLSLRREAVVYDDEEQISKRNKQLRKEFKIDFQNRLRELSQNNSLQEGVDYFLIFRPIGFRYEDPGSVKKSTEEERYAIAFQNYIIFRPIGSCNEQLVDFAEDAFREFFPYNLDLENFLEQEFLNNSLGTVLQKNRNTDETNRRIERLEVEMELAKQNMNFEEAVELRCEIENLKEKFDINALGDKYGVGIWTIYKSAEEFSQKVLGLIDHAWFFPTKIERSELQLDALGIDVKNVTREYLGSCDELHFKFDEFEANGRPLLHLYELVDLLRGILSAKDLQKESQDQVMTSLSNIFSPRDDEQDIKFSDTSELNKIEGFLNKLVMTLIMNKSKKVIIRIKHSDLKGLNISASEEIGVDDFITSITDIGYTSIDSLFLEDTIELEENIELEEGKYFYYKNYIFIRPQDSTDIFAIKTIENKTLIENIFRVIEPEIESDRAATELVDNLNLPPVVKEWETRIPTGININSWAPLSFISPEDQELDHMGLWLGIKGSKKTYGKTITRIKDSWEKDEETGGWEMSKKSEDIPLLEFDIPLRNADFDLAFFEKQTMFLDPLLQSYYEELLNDDCDLGPVQDLTITQEFEASSIRKQLEQSQKRQFKQSRTIATDLLLKLSPNIPDIEFFDDDDPTEVDTDPEDDK